MKRQEGKYGQPEGRPNEGALIEKEILRILDCLSPEKRHAAKKLLDELEKEERP